MKKIFEKTREKAPLSRFEKAIKRGLEPQEESKMYRVFHRTWYKDASAGIWPNGLEPECGEKHEIETDIETEKEARAIANEWNATHEKGRYSDKAEVEEI